MRVSTNAFLSLWRTTPSITNLRRYFPVIYLLTARELLFTSAYVSFRPNRMETIDSWGHRPAHSTTSLCVADAAAFSAVICWPPASEQTRELMTCDRALRERPELKDSFFSGLAAGGQFAAGGDPLAVYMEFAYRRAVAASRGSNEADLYATAMAYIENYRPADAY